MDRVESVEELFRQTIGHLKKVVAALTALQQAEPGERTALLVGAFLPQSEALLGTVENIARRQGSRTLTRKLRVANPPTQFEALPQSTDSLALTLWLIGELNHEADLYAALEKTGKLGSAKAGITELAALLVAQSKRFALEAHRFADL